MVRVRAEGYISDMYFGFVSQTGQTQEGRKSDSNP